MLNLKKLLTKMLADTSWKDDLTSKYAYLNFMKYRVRNGFCTVTFQTSGASAPNIPANTWTILGTLPENARPSITIYGDCGTRTSYNAELQIGADGRIGLNPSGATQVWAASVTFPVG